MAKRIRGVLLLMILLCLSGCGRKEEADREPALQDNDPVVRKLTEKVTLDARVELPKDWDGTMEICRVRNVFFNGKELMGKLYPEIPAEDWTYVDESAYGIPDGGYYEGNIWIESGQEPEPGRIFLSGNFNIGTERAMENKTLFKHNIYTDDYTPEREGGRELSFMSAEEAVERAEKYWTETFGMEWVQFVGTYSVTHEELLEEAEDQRARRAEEAAEGEPAEEPAEEEAVETFGEEDDCYDIRMEQVVNGIPLSGNYSHIVRKDGIYVPSGEITTIVGPRGIEYVSCFGNYEILETEEKEAAPMEAVYGALERKFKMMITEESVVDRMRLVYYPFPLSTDPLVREYELVPAWCFTFSYGGQPAYAYINALTGEEIAE